MGSATTVCPEMEAAQDPKRAGANGTYPRQRTAMREICAVIVALSAREGLFEHRLVGEERTRTRSKLERRFLDGAYLLIAQL